MTKSNKAKEPQNKYAVDNDQSLRYHYSVAKRLYKDLDTPLSKKCLQLLNAGQLDELVEMSVDPSDYVSAWDFSLDYQAISLLKKCENLPTRHDRQAAALEKFLQAEDLCKQTNSNLSFNLRESDTINGICFGEISYRAQSKISRWLGGLPNLDDVQWSFGPGATSACGGEYVTLGDKLHGKHAQLGVECTVGLAKLMSSEAIPKGIKDYVHDVYSDNHYSSIRPMKIALVNSNKLTFVPKTCKTDRAICVEPHLNTAAQRGYGIKMRMSLLKAGIDLQKAARVNSALAQIGSSDGSYATIDLSSASDTVSIATVYELLPFPWAERLSALRSPFTKMPDGTIRENEKFSSMGNGFTFELETILFAGIAHAVYESLEYRNLLGDVPLDRRQISVFGDDIIVPTACATLMLEVLGAFGFIINKEKTFLEGPFRESCGTDYFLGTNVRPYFIKKVIKHESQKFSVCNGLRYWAIRLCDGTPYAHPLVQRTWSVALQGIPEFARTFGPGHLGDAVIFADRRSVYERVGLQRASGRNYPGFNGWSIRAVSAKPFQREISRRDGQRVQMQCILLGQGLRLPIRGRFRTVYEYVHVATWCDYEGSWLS